MKPLSYILVLSVLVGCSSQRKVVGLYRSNFPELGFFATRIELFRDSTFAYEFRGDLAWDRAGGHYFIRNNHVTLEFKGNDDKEKQVANYDSIAGVVIDREIQFSNPAEISRPSQLKIGRNKLLIVRDGVVVKKQKGYSKHRKFIFWGDHYIRRRRFFLKKK